MNWSPVTASNARLASRPATSVNMARRQSSDADLPTRLPGTPALSCIARSYLRHGRCCPTTTPGVVDPDAQSVVQPKCEQSARAGITRDHRLAVALSGSFSTCAAATSGKRTASCVARNSCASNCGARRAAPPADSDDLAAERPGRCAVPQPARQRVDRLEAPPGATAGFISRSEAMLGAPTDPRRQHLAGSMNDGGKVIVAKTDRLEPLLGRGGPQVPLSTFVGPTERTRARHLERGKIHGFRHLSSCLRQEARELWTRGGN